MIIISSCFSLSRSPSRKFYHTKILTYIVILLHFTLLSREIPTREREREEEDVSDASDKFM